MSFRPNLHQVSFDDPEFNFSEIQMKYFNRSWEKQFGDEIFPLINEERFSVLNEPLRGIFLIFKVSACGGLYAYSLYDRMQLGFLPFLVSTHPAPAPPSGR